MVKSVGSHCKRNKEREQLFSYLKQKFNRILYRAYLFHNLQGATLEKLW